MSVETTVSYVVGCVPYVNARPLVTYFDRLGLDSPVQVLYDVPSKLPPLLNSGTVQAALVSSFEALRTPARTISEHGSISTLGAADSVRIFSKVPIDQIETLALDASSLTSIHLAQIVLIENHGIRPRTISMLPDLHAMLAEADACLLIGDKGMMADGSGLHILDLGLEWRRLTNLPFVWAAWIGGATLSSELVACLASALKWGQKHIEPVVRDTALRAKWPLDVCHRYLTSTMNYELTDGHLDGLRLFRSLLEKHGFLDESYFPEVVRATSECPVIESAVV